jgi:hypothetical protein
MIRNRKEVGYALLRATVGVMFLTMKQRSRVLILSFLAVSFAMVTACTAAPPASGNQNSPNSNASQSNTSQTKSAQQPNKSTTGTIEVRSVPPGAKVLLVPADEGGAGEPQPKGLTPTTITGLAPSKYTVDLEKPGYKFSQKEVVVKEGTTTKVRASLKRQ